MAAGDLRGVLTGNGNSVGASNAFTTGGPITVSVGDLIFVCFGQQTNLTATGVTDNLSNTYTAQNAGTDPGTGTGRAFWARASTAGSLSTVTVAASSSTNDFAGVVAVVAGPVTSSPVDKNPANNNNTDNTSPFTCPATGTLAQALEIVMCWMTGSGTSAAWSATAPNLKAGQASNSTNINVVIGYQAVNSTSTISPAFTGTNPTDSVQGTQSFKIDTTETPSLDRKTVFVLAPAHQIPRPSAQSWEWSDQPLFLNEAAPITESPVVFDWPTFPAIPFLQQWIFPSNPNLLGPPTAPNSQFDWPLPRWPQRPSNLSTWNWNYNLNLIGQDSLPSGEISAELPPQPQPRSLQLRTWSWSYNLNLTGKDVLPTGKISTELTPRPYEYHVQLRTWLWSYNLNLVGQDILPTGKIITNYPPLPIPPIQTWISTVNLLLAVPFSQTDWPTPPPRQRAGQSITASYNLNLIGQDRLPAGAISVALPPQPALSAIQLKTWIQLVNLALVTTPPLVPHNQFDWPINPGPRQPTSLFTAAYNKNLVGQDKLPAGKSLTDLSPRAYTRAVQTWISSVNLALTTTTIPFNQFDWPLSAGHSARQPLQILVDTLNLNLLVQQPVPFRQQDWPIQFDLFKAGARRAIDGWITGIRPFVPPPPPIPPRPNTGEVLIVNRVNSLWQGTRARVNHPVTFILLFEMPVTFEPDELLIFVKPDGRTHYADMRYVALGEVQIPGFAWPVAAGAYISYQFDVDELDQIGLWQVYFGEILNGTGNVFRVYQN